MEKIVIITGGSKGLGLGLANEYHKNGYRVFSIARTKLKKTYSIEQFTCDLSAPETIESTLLEIFKQLNAEQTEIITLINNAGDLGEINSLDQLNATAISYTIQVNLAAPLVLSSLFIKFTKGWAAKKKIINISSGAAVNPYGSWAMYCASKAGLDMVTKVIYKEQKSIKNGVKVVSIYPGIVDTNMQTKIRNTSKDQFKSVNRFINFFEKGELFTPEKVAEIIYNLDRSGALKKGKIIDIRKL
ncbi:SDR family NAD(P)-dependent oxidoreductase [Lutibacter sp.]|uniref:SDR family NAD(P)-dependent oxidoreductase n=1 Tax=Lutibacter sp. TaxID=1925666 RepID=UPI002736B1ED|nr:SDR family NAD(P)-dependent oxidoreductase [Lutibacter sp.]MDP3312511.1 SDR family NAD(P)-dependent oxidoreductase [Lutibacter sp.]